MATILLSAAGAAVGGLSSGTVLGLSGAVLGRAAGATLGRVIDQKLLGAGSDPIERGRIDRFRITGANEGAPIAQLFGRMRLGGQVIWSTQFLEIGSTTGGGGKGAPSQPKTTTYSYSISLALGLCEGEIRRIGRIWADGVELDRSALTMRIYPGDEEQMPDPLIEAVEGAGVVPAYRGLAYVVLENLDLGPFGNRVPQFAFEVSRSPAKRTDLPPAASDLVRAVALMPGTGEYALATSPVSYSSGFGNGSAANVSAEGGGTDFSQSLEQLRKTLPNVESVSIVYSWFGDDLRAGSCSVKPKVEDNSRDGSGMPWRAGGIGRTQAEEIARIDGRPVYGGTPADQSAVEAIRAVKDGEQSVLFYPFLLMEILSGNNLSDPWRQNDEQPELPWRGRITGSVAPGHPDSPDGTDENRSAVDAFFGTVTARDFSVIGNTIHYSGPDEWSYSRFILHAAALCALAGGVEAFCIGSEMRSLTQIRDDNGFPAVERFCDLAAEVRKMLPNAKLTYAADWSEYFGYHPQDGSGDVLFHLDPLWSDSNIDFIGIDNYMPLSDWRDEGDHADAAWNSISNLEYLKQNIEGGEGFDWYYPSQEAREAQRRVQILPGSPGLELGPVVEFMTAGSDRDFGLGSTDHTGVFSTSVALPVIPTDATLAAFGDAINGAWVGVRDNGSTFRVRAGDVSAAKVGSDRNTVILDLPISDLPFDGEVHEVVWSFDPVAPGRISLWIDGILRGREAVVGGGAMAGQVWATAGHAHFLDQSLASHHVVGEPNAVWPVNLDAELKRHTALFETEAEPWLYRYKALRGWWENQHYDRKNGLRTQSASQWQPRSKPIWFTEIGCAAIDKGTNQPNKFLDPKSSESSIPHYSTGRRDDFLQAQYIRALMSYWSDPEINPISEIYDSPMIDIGRAHVWAWDARPWPAFPNDIARWSDGANWTRGHWLNGRLDAVPLDHVVAELCDAAGVRTYDVSRLHGLVRGYLSGETETARARLQSLMLTFGFQAVEKEGCLVFLPLPDRAEALVRGIDTALGEDGNAGMTQMRAAEAETTGRMRVGFVSAEDTYFDRVAEAVFPSDGSDAANAIELPLALTPSEGQAVSERWLAEARVARDQLSFSLPPSSRCLGAGAMISMEDGSTWRIDRVEDRGARAIEAVRVEPSVFDPSDAVEAAPQSSGFLAPVPVSAVFADLPLLTGDEAEHAPHLAVVAQPWPGTVAIYSSPTNDGFTLNTLVERSTIAGTLESPLFKAKPGLWDRSGPLRIRLGAGALSSSDSTAVFNGANVAAIGAGDDGLWELLQFRDATLIEPDVWEIGLRLRGQQGTDAVVPDVWPEGSLFVLLDGGPVQIELPSSARGLERHYRIGPASRSLDDRAFVSRQVAFRGIGLRPYSPSHLRSEWTETGRKITWIRRSRLDADSWEGLDVPLGEAAETYLLRILDPSGVKREVTLQTPEFHYSDEMQVSDGISTDRFVEVAQVSERFGPGPFARIELP